VKFTITGGTGFIGRRLVERLLADEQRVHILGRSLKKGLAPQVELSLWDAMEGEPSAESFASADAVIHLAGEPVAQRWTPEAKRRILVSRVEGTRRLVEALSRVTERPRVLVCASAIGLYGSRGDEVLTETSSPGTGFLTEVCQEWEQMADLAEPLGIRVAKVRIGVVLGMGGGALAQMLPPFKMGLGGKLGSGEQWMSWIHLDDLVSLIRFAAERSELRGPVNATSPNPVRNAHFSQILARVLRRPAFLPVPAIGLRILFGEMAEVLLASQRVLPKAAEAAGFTFKFAELMPALRDLFS
jgi:uncharacterized protein (TIGR01777 family)